MQKNIKLIKKRKLRFLCGLAEVALGPLIIVADRTHSIENDIIGVFFFAMGIYLIFKFVKTDSEKEYLSALNADTGQYLKKRWLKQVVLFAVVVIPIDFALILMLKDSPLFCFVVILGLTVPFGFFLFSKYGQELKKLETKEDA